MMDGAWWWVMVYSDGWSSWVAWGCERGMAGRPQVCTGGFSFELMVRSGENPPLGFRYRTLGVANSWIRKTWKYTPKHQGTKKQDDFQGFFCCFPAHPGKFSFFQDSVVRQTSWSWLMSLNLKRVFRGTFGLGLSLLKGFSSTAYLKIIGWWSVAPRLY